MKDFKGELALLCLQRGVSLEELQEVVSSMVESPTFKRDKGGLKYICTLDGYDYFLGEYFKEGMSWYEAHRYAESLGSGWEVPARKVLKQMQVKKDHLGIKDWERLWSGEEHSNTRAWLQNFASGLQIGGAKTYTLAASVRPVLKIKC